jgi:hypothetical protein
MKVEQSKIPDVELIGPDAPEFHKEVNTLVGSEPEGLLLEALSYSVIVRNAASRSIALLGVRFDMLSPTGKPCASVHYSDALRNPGCATFGPATTRFVCAEHGITSAVLQREAGGLPDSPHYRRLLMNLGNLRKMLSITASLDCIAYEDGEFDGPDRGDAYARIGEEREQERAFVAQLDRTPKTRLPSYLNDAQEKTALKSIARILLTVLNEYGREEMLARAQAHHFKIKLWRKASQPAIAPGS